MSRADETETEKAAGQDGPMIVRCRCNNGGNCHRLLHEEGTQCERTINLTGTSRHRICKGCRTKKRKVCSEDVETTTSVDDQGGDKAHDSASPGQTKEGSAGRTALNASTTDHPYPRRRRGRPSKKSKNSTNDTTTADSVGEQSLRTRDGHVVTEHPCACKGGESCYREDHLQGESCTNVCRVSKNVRHRVCKTCRSRPKASGSPKSKRKRRSLSAKEIFFRRENSVDYGLFEEFDVETRSDEDGVTSQDSGVTSQDSGGESISSEESLIDDIDDSADPDGEPIIDVAEMEMVPFCLPCEETRINLTSSYE